MALTVTAIAERAQQLAPDLGNNLQIGDYEDEVPAAVLKLSQHQTQDLSKDITGDGSITLHTLSGWLRTNEAYRLEHPIDEADIAAPAWRVLRSGTGWALKLNWALSSGEQARLWYRAHHTVESPNTTVDDDLVEPVARFCAAIVLRRFATRFLHAKRAGTLGGSELIDLRSQAKEAADLAQLLDREALELLGVVEDDAKRTAGGGEGDVAGEVGIAVVTPPWEAIGL